MSVVRGGAAALAVVMSVGAAVHSLPADAGSTSVRIAGGLLSIPVISIRESKFKSVIQQQFDYSCGSAALATLLSFHYDKPTTEAQTFEKMFEVGDQDAIRKFGFSLLDMKNYLQTIGMRADGFNISLDDLSEAGIPAIALIDTGGYKHFVVIKGLDGGDVLVGDPAFGSKVYTRADFEVLWQGIIFVVRDELQVAQSNFNIPEEWLARTRAPTQEGLDRQGLSSFQLRLPAQNEF